MPLIETSYFGTIEEISSQFAAYSNWEDTAIIPFSKKDIQAAISEKRLDNRSFQDASVQNDLDKLLSELSLTDVSKEDKDQALKDHARKYHIERVAFLCENFPNEPIKLDRNMKIIDGSHRVMAALFLELETIDYIKEQLKDL